MSFAKAVSSKDYDSTVINSTCDLPGPARPVSCDILTVGTDGTPILYHYSDKTVTTEQTVSGNAAVNINVTVTGAAVGNPVSVGVYPAMPVGLLASGQVVSANTVRVTVYNYTGSPVVLPAGAIRADVWQH